MLCWLVVILDPRLIGHAIVTLTTILALLLQSQFAAAPLLLLAHLFDVLNQSPVLQNVVRLATLTSSLSPPLPARALSTASWATRPVMQ